MIPFRRRWSVPLALAVPLIRLADTVRQRRCRGLLLALAVPLALAHPVAARAAMPAMGEMNMAGGRYLYVWLGDARRHAHDRLAVVDFRPRSPGYGDVLATAVVPGRGGVDNEPHHCMISPSRPVVACGGLLSALRNQPGLFFFDISNLLRPRYMFSRHTALSAITDDLRPLPGGGFLVSDMGSSTGGSPGRIAELDSHLRVVHEWPERPPADGFNPHGISLRPDLDLMLTSDFVDPASTLNATAGPILFRSSVRVWDLSQRTITRTIPLPAGTGTMDVKLIPGNPDGLAYTAGLLDGRLYLVDPRAGSARPVLDLHRAVPDASPQVMVLSPDGRRLFVPLHGGIAMLDITEPDMPRVLDVAKLSADAGPHDTLLTRDGRLVVTDYFLDEDGFGKVHADGDHRVRVFDVGARTLREDARFDLDFDRAVPGLRLRPHGTDAL